MVEKEKVDEVLLTFFIEVIIATNIIDVINDVYYNDAIINAFINLNL